MIASFPSSSEGGPEDDGHLEIWVSLAEKWTSLTSVGINFKKR